MKYVDIILGGLGLETQNKKSIKIIKKKYLE